MNTKRNFYLRNNSFLAKFRAHSTVTQKTRAKLLQLKIINFILSIQTYFLTKFRYQQLNNRNKNVNYLKLNTKVILQHINI